MVRGYCTIKPRNNCEHLVVRSCGSEVVYGLYYNVFLYIYIFLFIVYKLQYISYRYRWGDNDACVEVFIETENWYGFISVYYIVENSEIEWRRIWITTLCSCVRVHPHLRLHLHPNRLRYILGGILLHCSSFVFRIRHNIHSTESRLWVHHIHTGFKVKNVCSLQKSRIRVFLQRDRWKMGISIWGQSTNTVAVLICGYPSRVQIEKHSARWC